MVINFLILIKMFGKDVPKKYHITLGKKLNLGG